MTTDRPPRRRIGTATTRVVTLATLIAALAAVTFTQWLAGEPPIDDGAPYVALALPLLFALAEMCVIHVHYRTEATSFSLCEIALVLGLVYASPGQVVAARLLGGLLALVVHRHQRWLKVGYNLALFSLETCVAIVTYRFLLGAADPFSPAGWMPALAAAIAALATGSIAVSLAIAASEGRRPRGLFSGFLGLGVFTTVGAATAGLAGAAALHAGSAVGWLFTLLAVGAFLGYRSHARLRQDHRSLELIHDFTRTVGGELHTGTLNVLLLRELSELLRADTIELVLRSPDAPTLALALHDDVVEQMIGASADALGDEHESILGRESSRLFARVSRRRPSTAHPALPVDLRDAVVSLLPGPGGPGGSLLAGNRRGDVETFTSADERLIATLANHSSIVLRNADLVARLRQEVAEREQEALHDSLTGLGNRKLLDQSLSRAVANRSGDELVAVLLIDLDRFKEVNDTLGHHQGDVLLQEIARRLVAVVGPKSVAVRFGGDEFAVITSDCATRAEVLALARTIETSITAPFELGDVMLDVGASIGVAICPDNGIVPSTLLQRADVAMYAAKSGTTSIERYDPSVDHNSPWRLALGSALRRTVEREELLVEYQPKADLQTGAVVGVEALARWHHPHHGFVSPDVFIPIAEHTGLIRTITEHVLAVSLTQCRTWRDEGFDMHVAVNLSVRNLLDDQLPSIVSEHLRRNRLPANALTLEITEGTIIADPARTVGILNRLSSMGVTLAIDDFGTGYSSLAYLRRLPVDELKIDRSFVSHLATNDEDAAIVRSTIELAANLGLMVTAEGVEDGPTWQLLRMLGCHLAQGHFLGKPMGAAHLLRWLRERAEDRATLAELMTEGTPAA